MAGILDYIDWRGDIPFSENGMNDIDSLIFTRLAYVLFDGIVPESFTEGITLKEAADIFLNDAFYRQKLILKEDEELLRRMAKAQRYMKLKLSGYMNKIDFKAEKQAAAFTIEISKGLYYIAFRGTDNTLVGWKEDFNMCFISPVPAQQSAADYVNSACDSLVGKFYIGGHSKGGNMAVYAAAKCRKSIKKYIAAIYNNDGPGFSSEFMNSTEYSEIKDKVKTFVPQSSVVGMLFEHEDKYTIVKSNQKGILQHDPFSWELMGAHFICEQCLSPQSMYLDKATKEWLKNMSKEDREVCVDALFNVLAGSTEKSLADIYANPHKAARDAFLAYKNLDDNTRSALNKLLQLVGEVIKNNISRIFK